MKRFPRPDGRRGRRCGSLLAAAGMALLTACSASGSSAAPAEIDAGDGASEFAKTFDNGSSPKCDVIDVDELDYLRNQLGLVTGGVEREKANCVFSLHDSELAVWGAIRVERSGVPRSKGPLEREQTSSQFETQTGRTCTTWAKDWADHSTTRCENGSHGDHATQTVVSIEYVNADPALIASREPNSYGRLSAAEQRGAAEVLTNYLVEAIES